MRPAERAGPHIWQPRSCCARRPWFREIGRSRALAVGRPLLPWHSECSRGGKQGVLLFFFLNLSRRSVSPENQFLQLGGTCPNLIEALYDEQVQFSVLFIIKTSGKRPVSEQGRPHWELMGSETRKEVVRYSSRQVGTFGLSLVKINTSHFLSYSLQRFGFNSRSLRKSGERQLHVRRAFKKFFRYPHN